MTAQLVDVSSTGLTTLYEPEADEAIVDIVFVHGLQGHPQYTWSSGATKTPRPPHKPRLFRKSIPATTKEKDGDRKSRFQNGFRAKLFGQESVQKSSSQDEADEISDDENDGVFWPRDLLPTFCPDAQIITWGYNSNVTQGFATAVNKSNIFSHSKDLLYALERERVLGRKVIFVAHSLGGIIVKEVLRRSETSSEPGIRNIVECTEAVIFMATPHRGSKDMAELGDVVRRVASTLLRVDSNAQILRALGVDSPELELCRESFITQWRKYDFRVKTFQEALAMTGINVGQLADKVVPDSSSSLEDLREHAETIEANHKDICRFSSPSDPGFRKVAGTLKKIVNEGKESLCRDAKGKGKANFADVDRDVNGVLESETLAERQQRECLESLSFDEMERRQANISPPFPKTCQWLFMDFKFRNWLENKNQSEDERNGLL
ncbi:hypothetical protein EJ08DRAFT_697781 [Tothia fuscella]|uniref:DUF676 domain-containing protein n=1 Tax=Tothia fuscella TaxID=1048955 RepID=A0A9P4NRH8_9PEZI|nr:hypothetical protein EJ08DRAFT_697781 [Tothia fuscella]